MQFSQARQPHLHSGTLSRDDKSIVIATTSNRTNGLIVEVEAQAVATRLSQRRQVGTVAARATSGSSETVDTGVQRKIDAVGSALVEDVEEKTHVVFAGVVVAGEVTALGDVLVVGAETLESVFGEGDLDGWRGGAAGHAGDVRARSEPACAGADGTETFDHRLGTMLVGFLVGWGMENGLTETTERMEHRKSRAATSFMLGGWRRGFLEGVDVSV